jgi:hypothetical protein
VSGRTSPGAEPTRGLVVFDVNIYLDVAQHLGPGASWEDFLCAAAESAVVQAVRPNTRIDSLLALAISKNGSYGKDQLLEIWSGKHLDDATYLKLVQPEDAVGADFRSEDVGFGWSHSEADAFMGDIFDPFWEKTGGYVSRALSYESPPLDHEDGCVYATARDAGAEKIYYERYCVTRDKEFRNADLRGDITVLHPHEWVTHMRQKMNPVNRLAHIQRISAKPTVAA